ncbi:sensor histidine kinase [Pontiella agarivorans]|uniref:histidine kinase n=1 Tax=Pontiella agarivorans TaxID=3038953 RepID=A0ABU5MW18_9BACT|nr:ATP-binding protein [Pontiella agarivorans]MDZ8118318.1 ATP-binding protein [Pontiella agarivorans]
MKSHRSIRWMLIMWNMLLLAAVLITLLFLHYHLQRTSAINRIDATLQSTLIEVLPTVAPPDARRTGFQSRFDRPPPDHELPNLGPQNDEVSMLETETQQFLEQLPDDNLYLMAWDPEGRLTHHIGQTPEVQYTDYEQLTEDRMYIVRQGARELVTRHPTGALVVIGKPLDEVSRQLRNLRGYLILIGGGIFLLGFGGGRIMIGRALKPIREISRTAEEISAGAHSRRIELADAPKELESLAGTLNRSFDHLDAAIENQKRFSADASHELRTPIAVVLAQTQAGLKKVRTPAEYQLILEACLRAGTRMKSMADSLLDLTRIDGKEAPLNKTVQSLNNIVFQTVEDAAFLSDLHPVDFHSVETSLNADVDETRIQQILMNLIRNAILHNPDGCPIHVALTPRNGFAEITISDEGSGIPEDSLARIFERFYRADQSRSREQGGAGLGLSIVKSLVEAHGGKIDVHNDGGAVFTIRIPLA